MIAEESDDEKYANIILKFILGFCLFDSIFPILCYFSCDTPENSKSAHEKYQGWQDGLKLLSLFIRLKYRFLGNFMGTKAWFVTSLCG